MTAAAPFLRLLGVSKRFGGVLALDDIDWDVRPGEIHCLVGENGCGKSTLIKTVAGVIAPSTGAITIDGNPVVPLTPARAKALGIQVIFQDLSLFPNLGVAENIAIESHLSSLFRPALYGHIRRLAQSTLARLDFKLNPDALVSDLSVAERQIVAICRGLAGKARLIFMDEPTSSLTRAEVHRLLEIVMRLKADGIAVVFVSHRLDEVVEIAERVTVMRDGHKVGTWPANEVNQRRIAHLMTGMEISHVVAARDLADAPPLLTVDRLSRAGEYSEVSFTLHRGEVLGLIGLLGSGRTELALSLFGMTQPESGMISLEGRQLHLTSNREALKAGIAYVSEDRLALGVILKQSIEDNIILAVMNQLCNRLGLMSPERRTALAADWVRRLAIKIPGLDRPVQTLSGGNQQRIVLAKWLAAAPRVMVLDSPTVGVDIKNKQSIYEVVADLARRGVGVLLISDEVSEIFATGDRVLHMRAGRIVEEAVPGRILEHELEERIYA
jgi:simple sugar transport system ATP-binding protein